MVVDSRAIKEIIAATSSQKKRDLLDKINSALEAKNKASITSTGTPNSQLTAPATTAKVVEEIVDPKKAKVKKQEKISKMLGDNSIYANTVEDQKEPILNEPKSNTGLRGVWNRFVNKRINKIQEKTDKKLDKIDKDITKLENQRHTRDRYEDKAQQDYMVPDDFDLYVPNTYTGAGTMDFRDIDDPIFSLGGSAQNVMGPEGNTEFKNKRNFYDDYLELEKYINEDDEAIRRAVKDKLIQEKNPIIEREDMLTDITNATVREAARQGLEEPTNVYSASWNSIFSKIADEYGFALPHRSYNQVRELIDKKFDSYVNEEKRNREKLLQVFEAFGRQIGRQQMPTKYQDNQGKWYSNPEYKYGTTTFRDIGNYDLEEWDEWLNLLNEGLDRHINKKQSKKGKVQDMANKKLDFRDDLYL